MKAAFLTVIVLALGLMVPGQRATAQDLEFSILPLADCLTEAGDDQDDRRLCIGTSAQACIAATPDGSTTYGMGGCLDQERGWWDTKLNSLYRMIRAKARANDTEMKRIGASVPSTEIALRDMQRAWIAWRDATCDFERAQWGGGSGSGVATLLCQLRLTGEQALYLEQAWMIE